MTSPDTSSAPVDGRSLRRVKTRRAILDGLFSLLDAGVMRPTAAQIAERGGVSLRSITQTFGTQEQLFQIAAAEIVQRSAAQAKQGGDAIARVVQSRARFAEDTAKIRRAAALAGRSETVDATGRAWRKARRAEIERLLAEHLEPLDAEVRKETLRALEGSVSAALWDELRSGMRLSMSDAARTMDTTVRALVEAAKRSQKKVGAP